MSKRRRVSRPGLMWFQRQLDETQAAILVSVAVSLGIVAFLIDLAIGLIFVFVVLLFTIGSETGRKVAVKVGELARNVFILLFVGTPYVLLKRPFEPPAEREYFDRIVVLVFDEVERQLELFAERNPYSGVDQNWNWWINKCYRDVIEMLRPMINNFSEFDELRPFIADYFDRLKV